MRFIIVHYCCFIELDVLHQFSHLLCEGVKWGFLLELVLLPNVRWENFCDNNVTKVFLTIRLLGVKGEHA